MKELTIKINKTTLFILAALVIGAGLGFGGTKLLSGEKTYALPKDTNTGVVANNDSVGSAAPVAPQITLTKTDRVRGAKKPLVTLVEFSDFQCPYCQRFHPTMLQVMKDYGTKVAWVYRHFPLSFHQAAQGAAEASECAGDQGKFWELADMMFKNGQGDGTGLAKADLQKYAKDLKLNTSKFDKCLSSGKYTSKVKADMASGSAAGVNGTPGTVLIDKNGKTQLISGAVPYAQLKAAIDAAL